MTGVGTADAEVLRHVLRHALRLGRRESEAEALRAIHELCGNGASWRQVLARIPLDRLSFQLEAGVERTAAIAALTSWCRGFKTGREGGHQRRESEVFGYLSVLLITLITMEPSDGDAAREDHDCPNLCHALVRDASVRRALVELYSPARTAERHVVGEWATVRRARFEFHRHGTTSFLLRGKPEQVTARHTEFALKCVLFPYADIPVIAAKTRSYEAEHNSLDANGRLVGHMVRVWASTDNWILMDFAEGRTLAEEIDALKREAALPAAGRFRRRRPSPAGNVRLDLIRRVGLPLLAALAELHRCGKRHEDLSPTNIIVHRRVPDRDGREYDLTFVDFGRNYLYSGALAGSHAAQSVYVAPEVRANSEDVPKADLYSLGRILIALGDVGENRDDTIPDRFYGQAPLIARVVEDLIDVRPDRRLLVFPVPIDDTDVYHYLRQVLEQELDVTQAALVNDPELRPLAIPYDRHTVVETVRTLFPVSREPKRRRRIYRMRKQQGVLGDARRSMHARWLLFFSVVSSLSYFVSATVCVLWFLRDLGIDVLGPPVQLLLRPWDVPPDVIPLVDDLRAPDYRLGKEHVWENLPARIIGLSFALASVRYYQNILGGLTTLVAGSSALPGSLLRVATEVAIRLMAPWASWLILWVNLVDVDHWPLGTAIGYTGVVFSNLLCAAFASRYLALAREARLSTVPPEHQKIIGLDAFRQWGPTVTLYSTTVWIFAYLIINKTLKDTYVYALSVALVNIGLFYVLKTGINALDVRTGLNRCFLAAERLRYEAEATYRPKPLSARKEPVLVNPD
ncbi:protein kinase domain-containing protein [Saccharothrix australiensis]|uniref:Serine/threonine protein kinase n=1 Tax=Saccharothrix australiensis TaxID=2072 RepID=A0A495W2M3_9PSEU|nr:hypothetical protein [Saccharothrix australiensis]RKT55719.1 serine/threonine protein kinase [Saccharothrix australiensis]